MSFVAGRYFLAKGFAHVERHEDRRRIQIRNKAHELLDKEKRHDCQKMLTRRKQQQKERTGENEVADTMMSGGWVTAKQTATNKAQITGRNLCIAFRRNIIFVFGKKFTKNTNLSFVVLLLL